MPARRRPKKAARGSGDRRSGPQVVPRQPEKVAAPSEVTAETPLVRRLSKRALVAIWGAVAFVLAAIATPLIARYVPYVSDRVDQIVDADPLVMVELWPATEGCDPSTSVSMAEGGPSIDTLTFDVTNDHSAEAVLVGAAAREHGQLTMKLRTRDSSVLQVDDMQVIVLRRDSTPDARWVLVTGEGQCGGGNDREYELDLDRSSMIRLDEADDEAKGGGGLGTNVQASFDDPARIVLNVRACAASYDFMIRLKYSYGGNSYTRDVGTTASPYRIIGGVEGVPAYYVPVGATKAVRVKSKDDTASGIGPSSGVPTCTR